LGRAHGTISHVGATIPIQLLQVLLLTTLLHLSETHAANAVGGQPNESPSETVFSQAGKNVSGEPEQVPAPNVPQENPPFLDPDGSLSFLRQNAFHLDQALTLPHWLHLGLQYRTRYESYTEPFRQGETTGGQQLPVRTLVEMGVRVNALRVFAELMDARALATTGTPITNRMEDLTDILQLYGALSSENFLGLHLPTEFKVGRFTMNVGRGWLIGRCEYCNVPNAFQGLQWSVGEEKTWLLQAFVVRPVIRDPTTLDKSDANSLFWGGSVGQQRLSWFHTEAYVFVFQQKAQATGDTGVDDESTAAGQVKDLYTFGGRAYMPKAVARVDYDAESDWQLGDEAIQQGGRLRSVFAHAQHLELGYTIPVRWRPRAVIAFDYASGNRNPTNGHDQRFNSLFGAVPNEFGPAGIWQPFTRSNIISPGYGLGLSPLEHLQLSIRHRFWWLAASRDIWNGTGLQDPTGKAGSYLGQHLDSSLSWTLGPNVQIQAGWAYLVKGTYIQHLNEQGVPGTPNTVNSSYTYFQTTLKF
jgi:hypothetical protein